MKTKHEFLITYLDKLIQRQSAKKVDRLALSVVSLAKQFGYRTDHRYLINTFKPKIRKLFRAAGYMVANNPPWLCVGDHMLIVAWDDKS